MSCLNCDTMPDPDPSRVHPANSCPWRLPAAPDVSTDTGALREALAQAVPDWVGLTHDEPLQLADALLPALRDLIAERDQAVAAVERVEALLRQAAVAEQASVQRMFGGRPFPVSISQADLRRALDGAT